jgi:hypothetical protein
MCWDNISIHPFLTNLEDEISVKGVGFVKPKICIRKKIIKINKEMNKIVNSDTSNYTWALNFEGWILKPRINNRKVFNSTKWLSISLNEAL